MKTNGEQPENNAPPFFEVLTAKDLAARWQVPESWVREQTRSRAADPIPHVRLGRYIRFSLNAELAAWWARHQSGHRKPLDCC